MNREDIIRVARAAGMVVYEGEQDRVLFEGSIVDALTRFAALVIAADSKLMQQAREALAGYRREMNEHQPCDAERALEARIAQEMKGCVDCKRYQLSAQMWRNEAYKHAGIELPWQPEELLKQEYERGFEDGLKAAKEKKDD